ncbi:ribonuclease Y [Methanobrevibacter cuticularis]|uniref:Ribonuclease Y n=1 Tax=Methanobrevibacter cuticularis TaxID=47311 RepID=A0A166DNN0_9EURY|nr:TIGR00295 family protein [Methanobrevibacter cuticularis]KZX15794.1 ribonuclease Y [Methanobrevibacter cuticularis]
MPVKVLKKEGCPDWVINHSIAVYKKAMEISKNFEDADIDLIKEASLLHDIGRSKTNTICHGIIGAKLAIENGFSKDVGRIIERHVGAGITEEEAVELGLPKKSYLPATIEEKIVSHSDNLINGSEEVDIDFVINKWEKRIPNSDEAIARLKKTHKELLH